MGRLALPVRAAGLAAVCACAPAGGDAPTAGPRFVPVQPELFAASGAEANLWGDADNDGDLDLFVSFRGRPNRLYRNDGGRFTDVAAAAGLADTFETRAAAWGDFDGDGRLDLYVGFSAASPIANKLYRNDGGGRHFTDVAAFLGVASRGETRQVAFVDFDHDGDVDLFVAFRDRPNQLFRNDRGMFTDVAPRLGLADPRKTVGAVWYDYDQDGDLDLFVANQEGDANGFFRNDGDHFTDIAAQLGVDQAGRPASEGSVGPSVADYDDDGDLDLFIANYGPDVLYRNDGGRFVNVADALGIASHEHSVTSAWGDFDNDGRIDLYVCGYLNTEVRYPDHLFHNEGTRFVDVIPADVAAHDADHGVQWADFDGDGVLDLALANNNPQGSHYLFHNELPPGERANHSLQVLVLDERGHYTRAGSEVRVFRPGTRTVLGTRLVDTGSGYDSQSAAPVHFGLGSVAVVDVEITVLGPAGRRVARVPAVDAGRLAGRPLVVRVAPDGTAR